MNRLFYWCRGTELNCRRRDFQSLALPPELPRLKSAKKQLKMHLIINKNILAYFNTKKSLCQILKFIFLG